MLAATLLTLAMGQDVLLALVPLGVGVLAAFVAYGRWRLVPHQPRRAASLESEQNQGRVYR